MDKKVEDIKRLLASIPPEERARVFREAIASEFKERFGGRVDAARNEHILHVATE